MRASRRRGRGVFSAWILTLLMCALGTFACGVNAGEVPPPGYPLTWQLEGKFLPPVDRAGQLDRMRIGGKPGNAEDPGVTELSPDRMPVPVPEQELYDVQNYEIELTVDLDATHISGSVIIDFDAVSEPLAEIILDFTENMTVTSANWVGFWPHPLDVQNNDNLLIVDLPLSSPHWDSGKVQVHFEGTPQFDGFYGFQFDQTPAGTPIAASLSQPWSARSWWPCKDDPRDKATFHTTLHVPAGMTGVSNGRLVEQQGQTFVWEESHPISTYHFAVTVSQYVELEDVYTSGGQTLDIRHYVYPEYVEAATVDFAPLPDMLDFCLANFGPYPFPDEKYGMVMFEWDGAMEHPTCTSYGSILVTGDNFYDTIVMHELAHMWFGNLVTCSDWSHTWLNEGFATYVEALWAEHLDGPEGLRQFMAQYSNFTWWDEPLVRVPDNPDPWYYFHNMVYHKGAWVLHMLRHTIGDAPFQACLQAYLDDPALRYGTATTQDFVDVCSATVEQDLSWFFDQWLYWTVHPVFTVDWTHPVPFDNRVLLTISQVQEPDPVFGDLPFQMPIDVRLLGAGMDMVVTVFNDQWVQTFDIAVPAGVGYVELDPDGWLLHEHSVVISGLDEAVPAAQPVRLLPPVPNPFNPRCLIRWESALFTRDAINIYDLQGHRVAAQAYPLQAAGMREFIWDGTDQQGRACATGVYLYDVTCQAEAGAGKSAVSPDAGKSTKAPGTWRLKGKMTLSR